MIQPYVRHLRTGAAAAALVLAVLSRGDAFVLAVALALVAWRPAGLAVVPALAAASWRWGSASLEGIAGAQAVLGSAATVGPTSAAVASCLAGAAVLLATPQPAADVDGPPKLLVAAAVGASVAVVVAGPAPGGELWQRVVAGVVAALAALAVRRIRAAPRGALALDGLGVVAAVGAVAAASLDAPGWSGTVDGAAAVEGLVIAVAAVALVMVGAAAMGQRRD